MFLVHALYQLAHALYQFAAVAEVRGGHRGHRSPVAGRREIAGRRSPRDRRERGMFSFSRNELKLHVFLLRLHELKLHVFLLHELKSQN
jgi:hypothetical protein